MRINLQFLFTGGALALQSTHYEKAQELIKDNILIDSHNDLPEKISDLKNGRINDLNLTRLGSKFHTDLYRLKEGGVKAQIWSAYVPCSDYKVWSSAVSDTLNQIDLIHRMIALNSDLELAKSSADVYEITKKGKIASMFGLEGGHSIDDSVGVLVRITSL